MQNHNTKSEFQVMMIEVQVIPRRKSHSLDRKLGSRFQELKEHKDWKLASRMKSRMRKNEEAAEQKINAKESDSPARGKSAACGQYPADVPNFHRSRCPF